MQDISVYRRARMQKCLKQNEAALRLGISKSYLCMIENLAAVPPVELLVKMAKLYKTRFVQ